MKQEFLQVNGLKVFTRIAGKGKPFLILHGWGGNGDRWLSAMNLLKNNFQVMAIDLPGFGKSEAPQSTWGLDDYAEFITNVADTLNWEKFYLLGHSFGGRIAIKLAIKRPQKIEKLILVGAAGLKHKFNLKTIFGKTLLFIYKKFPLFPK